MTTTPQQERHQDARRSPASESDRALHDVEPATFDHGAVSRFNAWFFRVLDPYFNHVLRTHKDDAFAGLGAGTVVEIGAGAGANLRRLAPGTRLLAVEPNVRMHESLRERALAAEVDMTLVPSVAESLPLPDASVDDVVCTLVLCTVADPDRALAEVRRVLRPGGTFRFVEHVAAPAWSPRRWLQSLIRRPWGWVLEGCDPARDTVSHLAAAGFSTLHVEHRKWRHSAFYPVNTAIWGIATR
jgi:ubiquinone/menaquinone biosynthesis C-methylase UbiE